MIIVNKKKTVPVKVPIPFDWLIGANVSGVVGQYNLTGFGVGNPQWNHQPDWSTGDIYGYLGAHNVAERESMINWLATKYGITI